MMNPWSWATLCLAKGLDSGRHGQQVGLDTQISHSRAAAVKVRLFPELNFAAYWLTQTLNSVAPSTRIETFS